MNWQNTLRSTLQNAPSAPASPVGPVITLEIVQRAEALREAATRFDLRTDNFAAGKGATCRDIAEKILKFGSFASVKQDEFAAKLVEWSKPRVAVAAPSPEKQNQQASGMLRVANLFTVMQKHAKFHAGDLTITRRNQDSLCWLVWKDVCIGKIDAGVATLFGKRIFAAGALQETVSDLLVEFEANPLAAAVKYGRLSGRCCSCGRDLTAEGSIEAGIGPICAQRFA